MILRKTLITVCFILLSVSLFAQEDRVKEQYLEIAEKIIDEALQNGQAYEMLRELCYSVGPRLSGSPQAAAAVEWSRQKMIASGLQNVHLQPLMTPHWVRGDIEEARIINSKIVGDYELTVCALGMSIGSGAPGVTGKVIEVHNFEEVANLGEKARNAIIFYNRAFEKKHRRTFSAYGRAVNQRSRGAIEAAKVGAAAVLVRSMTGRIDDVPHTGMMSYDSEVKKIPAAAISTLDADYLSQLLKREDDVQVNIQLSCQQLPDVESANVIGEITGSEIPDEVVLVGGHLDSWDKGHGAHDDGAGCVQSIEALRLIKKLGLQPKRTIRAVMFMNEENGLVGGKTYARMAAENGPKHLAALESDSGGFRPLGIGVKLEPSDPRFKKMVSWGVLLQSLYADRVMPGYGGADINPLVEQGVVTMSLMVDSNRYFDYHHADSDTFDKVNERELTLGAACMAVYMYVLANEGL